MSAIAEGGASAPRARSRGLPLRPLLVMGAAAVAAAAGIAFITSPKPWVGTDDAYLRADVSVVAPKVRGLVAEVLVRDNQPVRAGDPLIRLNPEEYEARLASARSDLTAAEAAIAAAQASLGKLGAEERLAASNVRAAQTAISAADAQVARSRLDRARYESLSDSGAVSRREVEQIRAADVGTAAEAERSRAALAVSRDQAGVTASRRGELLAAVVQARAARDKAAAALALAGQDQRHALIRAPVDGVVGDRSAQLGDYVQPGTRLLSVSPLHSLYVLANYKETQTARMLPGQPAELRVDALPGRVLKGEVESIAPGTGSSFALLPFEPGTGNFTKIVQRVPVRIRVLPGQADTARLRPGLSVRARVRIGTQANGT